MKKVMLAAAIALMGIAANAAALAWGVGYIEDATGNLLSGDGVATATLMLFTDEGMTAAVSGLGEGASVSNWEDGLAMTQTDDVLVNNPATTYFGKIVVTSADGKMQLESLGFQFTTSSLQSVPEAYFMTEAGEISGIEMIGGGDFADGGVFAGQQWQAVPEPTSGLLLLLGMAGLALRRKQA